MKKANTKTATAAKATKTIKTAKTTKTAPAAKAKKPAPKGKADKATPAKVEKVAKPATPAMDVEKVKARVLAIAHPKAAITKPETPKAETVKAVRSNGYHKLDETAKALRALARRYEFLANALERGAMLRVKTVGEMVTQMQETLDAFEDDSVKGLGAWVHAVPLLKEGATAEQHKAAILKSDKGRHYRRLVRGWLTDVRKAQYDDELIAR